MITEFTPANNKQLRFMKSKKTFLMLSGAVGAGKSYLGCWKGIMLNMMFPGNRGLICRKEATSLRESTIRTLMQILPLGAIVSYNQNTGVLEHQTPNPKKNSFIIFSGLDKKADQTYPTKIGSTEYGWIFVDEGTELTEGDWEMLSTRIRYNTGYKDMFWQMFTATNPDGPHHFLYKFFFKEQTEDREVILTTPYDNPYLPEDYLRKLEATLSGVRKERLLFGKWVQAEGIIYNSFNMEKHVSDTDFLDWKDYKTLIVGADSNYPLPRSAVLIGYTGEGKYHILDEFYKTYAHVEDLMEWIKNITNKTNKTIYVYHDPSDPTAIDKISNVKFTCVEKANNKVIPGISSVGRLFDNNLILINKCCVNTIKEIQSYRWKPNKDKEEPLKENDHLMDSVRYAVYTHNVESGKITLLDTGGFF